jgi:hypothetical protein
VRSPTPGKSCLRRGIAAAAVIAAMTAPEAHATPQYYYDVQISGVTTGVGITDTGSTQLTDSGSGSLSAGSYSFSVLAGPGVLGDENGLTLASVGSALGDVRSTTSFVLDNIVLTGPAGVTYVTYDVNFTLTGSFALSASGNAVANGLVGVADALGSLPEGANTSTGPDHEIGAVGPNSSVAITGTTHQQTGVNGSTATVTLSMYTDIAVGLNDGSAGGTVDFLDPLSFPTDGPVFNFFSAATGAPVTGWTANSSDGCIVDNQFLCSPTSPPPLPVDEPATLPVFVASIVAWAWWTRCRPRQRGERPLASIAT